MLWLLVLTFVAVLVSADFSGLPPVPADYHSQGLPVGPPLDAPPYMVDNTRNYHGVAPDKGSMNGPILSETDAVNFLKHQNHTAGEEKRQSTTFWMSGIAHGEMPLAPTGYTFYRNVHDFGAMGDGSTDDTIAINKAVSWYSLTDSTLRCGQTCGSTTVLGALVYFPPGIYRISTPIIQYYYTQFVGDPNDIPTIKGLSNFTGIALIDTDVYIPGGNGAEWYINQNQFYRQIRNFIIDLTAMPNSNTDSGQGYAPTGIHWQVAQSTSMQNIAFNMPISTAPGSTTAVGIFMENGSGGFLSDLTFTGGNIGFRAGSQQYTARNLKFTSCLTAISMVWDWGFTWKNIDIISCTVGLDCTNVGGVGTAAVPIQGTGSISVIDSTFNGVPYGILLVSGGPYPDIVLDNLSVENSASIVLILNGATIFAGSSGLIYFDSWAMGKRYQSTDGTGSYVTGFIEPAPLKPPSLLDGSGNFFAQSRPQYATVASTGFIVATANGIANDGTGNQTAAINTLLASSVGTPVFFPAGIYMIGGTVFVPVGSIIIGEGWSQFMGYGAYFGDATDPQVMIRVGLPGDSGTIQMSDLLFTVQGPTAGAILVEWNVHEMAQGSAAMWDCHFRVGGAAGTNLQLANCPKLTGSVNSDCMAATLLFHVTQFASGYFENVWAWVADHDIDYVVTGPDTSASQINIYAARGILIESQGPVWLYGTSSEHSIFYQYEVSFAQNIFMSHMQTETPYFQADPDATQPYEVGFWASDPEFDECAPESYCAEAWALRLISSSNVLIYSAGFYSFFQNYNENCTLDETCQLSAVETSYTQGLYIYNIFTKGFVEMVSPDGGLPPLLASDSNQNGYTTDVSVWLVLAFTGSAIGGASGPSEGGSGLVYVDQDIFDTPSPIFGCWPPCTFVMPSSTMPTETTIYFSSVKTTIIVGTSTIKTVTPLPVTTNVISFFDLTITSGMTTSHFHLTSSFEPPPLVITVGIITTTVYFLPVTSPSSLSGATTTPAIFYSLPTTVYVTNGVTQTFSEDQFTELKTITAPTMITTTFVETISGKSSTSSSTTVIPIWINIGGFYWSPVPLPTINPFPIPALPSFPPIPSPPCFKLFDIFSIDCPPDKTERTSTYIPGPNTPTCTASCGTECTLNCETTGTPTSEQETSTSSCVTQTNTVCTNGVCNTYVGCECPTATVTDYWVSCSSTSCTTTSSSVVSGCYVTASATTTGLYCPLMTITASDDEGDDDVLTDPGVVVSTATAPLVDLGGTVYIEQSGSIVAAGTTYSVPAVTGTGVVTLGGNLATVYPGLVGESVSFTGTEFTLNTGGAPTTTTSTTPTPTFSTGIAVAAYTTCSLEQCFYQWELFTLVPAATPAPPTSIPGCAIGNALYSSVVDVLPDPSNIPNLGPFNIDGLTGCYYEHAVGGGLLSCVFTPQYSIDCFGDGATGCAGFEDDDCGVADAGYELDDYVYW